MVIRIVICDDEKTEIQYLTLLVQQWSEQRENIDIKITSFDSAESFLFAYEADNTFDILLLDIQMKFMDGIGLAKEIRKENDTIQIIFITGFPNYISEGYEVSALHYLMKPVNERKFFEVLDRAVSRLQTTKRMVTFRKHGENYRISADDIYFVEAFSHHVTVHFKGREETFYERISDMEDLLGEGFFRCHRSYIVGMKHVRRITRSSIILDSGVEIPLSRSLYDKANQMLIRFC